MFVPTVVPIVVNRDPHMSQTASIEADARANPDKPARWTATNIAIHWTIVGLLGLQIVTQLWMPVLYEASKTDFPPGGMAVFFGYAHMVIGTIILLLMLYRFWDLFKFGRPPHPPGEPGWSKALATVNHWAFYGLLVAIPLGGMIAYFLKLDSVAEIHGWAAVALAALVVLHIAGAFAHQLWFKTSVLKRKMPGAGEATRDGRRLPETAGL